LCALSYAQTEFVITENLLNELKNHRNVTWKAGLNMRFKDVSMKAATRLLGTTTIGTKFSGSSTNPTYHVVGPPH